MTDSFVNSDIAEIANAIGDDALELSGKAILLCGGRGFLGRYFVEVFSYLNKRKLKKPCRLIVVDNLITAGKAGSSLTSTPHQRFIKHDIIKPLKLNDRVDFVIQAAGIASPYYYRAYPLETLEVSTAGTKNMLNIARNHRAKFLFFSFLPIQ